MKAIRERTLDGADVATVDVNAEVSGPSHRSADEELAHTSRESPAEWQGTR